MLWEALRKREMNFRRQAPIGRFVVDFVHFASSLIVEVDGYFHELPERRISDLERTGWLQSQGFRVIRFPEKRVRDDLNACRDLQRRLESTPANTIAEMDKASVT